MSNLKNEPRGFVRIINNFGYIFEGVWDISQNPTGPIFGRYIWEGGAYYIGWCIYNK